MANFIETDMVPIGKFLANSKLLKVPFFQRSYAWGADQVSQIWEDIVEAMQSDKQEYFLGPIVVKTNEDSLEIIDGQQRLTTCLIILSIIRRLFRFAGDDNRADLFRDEFFGKKNVETLALSEKFCMNDENNETFRKFIVADAQEIDIQNEQKKFLKKNSNYLLLQAILILWESIRQYCGEDNTRLFKPYKYLNGGVKVLSLEIKDEADAYIVFETLNDRGTPLDTMDLLKNHLFSRSNNHLEEVKSKWVTVRDNLREVDPKNSFLSHYWLSHHGRTTPRTDLFRDIRQQIATPIDATDFAIKLSDSSRIYAALQNPGNVFWATHKPKTTDYISALRILDSQQSLPVLLAAAEKFTEIEFMKLAKVLVNHAVRYNLICEGRTGVSSNYYAEIPKKIRSDEYSKASHINKHLRPIYRSDSEFVAAFTNKSLSNTKRARYLLMEIENYLSGSAKTVSSDTDVVNIEHVMPKQENQNWNENVTGIPPGERSNYVNYLGNMALVLNNENRKNGSKSFQDKKRLCFSKHNTFQHTSSIANVAVWDKEAILNRSKALAKDAVKIWKN